MGCARESAKGVAVSQIVLDAIAEELAQLERIVPVPAGPLGYGRDLSCVWDIDPMLREVDPFSVAAVWEASLRRITTDRGELPYGGDPEDLEYGWSVFRLLNRGLTPDDIRDAAGELQAELSKDDRVSSVSVALTQERTDRLRIEIAITPHSPLSPFARTIAVTPDGVEEL